ncbi:MAG: hypothetical protein WDN69_11725 [Aliidongia sp.]
MAGDQGFLRDGRQGDGDLRRNAERARGRTPVIPEERRELGADPQRIEAGDLAEQHQRVEIVAVDARMIADRHGAAGKQGIAVPEIDLAKGFMRQERVALSDTEIDGGDPGIASSATATWLCVGLALL